MVAVLQITNVRVNDRATYYELPADFKKVLLVDIHQVHGHLHLFLLRINLSHYLVENVRKLLRLHKRANLLEFRRIY